MIDQRLPFDTTPRTRPSPAPQPAGRRLVLWAGIVPLAALATCAGAGTTGATASSSALFSLPVILAHSIDATEAQLYLGRHDDIYISGVRTAWSNTPVAVPTPDGSPTAPVWTSTDAGQSFSDAMTTYDVGGSTDVGGGVDSDIVQDSHGVLYQVNSSYGSASIATSSDGGRTWSGVPVSAVGLGVYRPWLAFDPASSALYMAWGSIDGIHVGKASLGQSVPLALPAIANGLFAQNVLAVCSSPAPPTGTSQVDAACQERAGPFPVPGSIAVDRDGHVWLAFPRQHGAGLGGGVGIAESTDGGLTWTTSSVPYSGAGSDPNSTAYNFQVIRGDSAGNMYVVWTQGEDQHNPTHVYYSWLARGSTQWHDPVKVSVTTTAALGTLAVVRPGVVDIAYYGTDVAVGPSYADDNVLWNVYLAQAADALHGGALTTVELLPNSHGGGLCAGDYLLPLSLGGSNICGSNFADDVGDFFGLAVDSLGMAEISTRIDNADHAGTQELGFVRQQRPLPGARAGGSGAPIVVWNNPYGPQLASGAPHSGRATRAQQVRPVTGLGAVAAVQNGGSSALRGPGVTMAPNHLAGAGVGGDGAAGGGAGPLAGSGITLLVSRMVLAIRRRRSGCGSTH